MSSPIPAFYRVFFSTIDPLIALSGALTQIFAPDTILTLYNPAAAAPPAIETTVLLESTAGYLFSTMFLQIVMLRLRAADLTVWRCLQGSILIQDLAIIGAVLRALKAQHRLEWALVTGKEWSNLAILAGVGAIRAAFLLGIGVNGRGKAKKT